MSEVGNQFEPSPPPTQSRAGNLLRKTGVRATAVVLAAVAIAGCSKGDSDPQGPGPSESVATAPTQPGSTQEASPSVGSPEAFKLEGEVLKATETNFELATEGIKILERLQPGTVKSYPIESSDGGTIVSNVRPEQFQGPNGRTPMMKYTYHPGSPGSGGAPEAFPRIEVDTRIGNVHYEAHFEHRLAKDSPTLGDLRELFKPENKDQVRLILAEVKADDEKTARGVAVSGNELQVTTSPDIDTTTAKAERIIMEQLIHAVFKRIADQLNVEGPAERLSPDLEEGNLNPGG